MRIRHLLVLTTTIGLACCSDTAPSGPGSCEEDNGGCDPKAVCTFLDGVPVCACKTGYTGDGLSCTEIDAPILTLASPTEGTTVSSRSPSQLVVAGTVEDIDLESVTYSIDGESPVALPLDGILFSTKIDLANEDHTVHLLTIVARDVSGHWSEATRHFTVDRLAPRIEVSSPAEGTAWALQDSDILLFKGTVTDRDIRRSQFSLDAGRARPLDLEADGTFSFELALGDEDYRSHHVVISAADGLENEAFASFSFVVDRLAPRILVENLEDEQSLGLQAPSPFRIRWSAADAAPLASASYQLDGAAPVALPTDPPFAFDLILDDLEDYVAHRLVFEAVDSLGNLATEARTFFVDRVSPSLQIDLADNLLFGLQAPNPFPVTGQAIDGSIASLTYRIDGGAPVPIPIPAGQPEFSFGLPFEETDDSLEHQLLVEVIDRAGNSALQTRTYVVDRVAPRLAITAPATDAACGDSCSGAVFNLGSGPSLAFEGVVVDARLRAAEPLSATLDSESLSPSVTGQAWTCPWTLPAEDGAGHTFTLVAVDEAGNEARASRTVWVDRVAPTLVSSNDGRRLIERTATLATFSEPMEEASVRQATSFAPGLDVAGSSFGSLDARSFSFSEEFDLEVYRSYAMTIAATAADRAGNRLAADLPIRFLTAPVRPPYSFAFATHVSHPVMTTDLDGKPAVLWWDYVAHLFEFAAWNGRDAWTRSSFGDPAAYSGRPGSLRAISVRNDLELEVSFEAALRVSDGTGSVAVFAANGQGSWTTEAVGVMASDSVPSLNFGTGSFCFGASCTEVSTQFVTYLGVSGSLRARARDQGVWSQERVWMTLPSDAPVSVGGAGAVANSPRYLPARVTLGHTLVDDEGVAAHGLPGGGDPVFCLTGHCTSAWLAWADVRYGANPETCAFVPRLSLACTLSPATAASWKITEMSRSMVGDSFCSVTFSEVTLAQSDTTLALGVETDDGRVYFGTMPNGLCSVAPDPSSITWYMALQGKHPAVALGRDGRLYTAHVSNINSLVLEF